MVNKADPNKGNIANFPGGELPEDYHVGQADEMRPGDLSNDEISVWNIVAPELSKFGRLKKLYIEVIAEYCRIVVRLKDARAYLDDNDWTYETTGRHGVQIKSRPEVAQVNEDWRKFRSLVGELGLSPSSEKNLSQQMGLPFGNEFGKF